MGSVILTSSSPVQVVRTFTDVDGEIYELIRWPHSGRLDIFKLANLDEIISLRRKSSFKNCNIKNRPRFAYCMPESFYQQLLKDGFTVEELPQVNRFLTKKRSNNVR